MGTVNGYTESERRTGAEAQPGKRFFQTGVTSNSTISFSGSAGQGSNYFASYSYFDQKGIVPTTFLKRHTLFSKFTTQTNR